MLWCFFLMGIGWSGKSWFFKNNYFVFVGTTTLGSISYSLHNQFNHRLDSDNEHYLEIVGIIYIFLWSLINISSPFKLILFNAITDYVISWFRFSFDLDSGCVNCNIRSRYYLNNYFSRLSLSEDPALAMAFSVARRAAAVPVLLVNGTYRKTVRPYLDTSILQHQLQRLNDHGSLKGSLPTNICFLLSISFHCLILLF